MKSTESPLSSAPSFSVEQLLKELPVPLFTCNRQGILHLSNTAFDELCELKALPGTSVFEIKTLKFFDGNGRRISSENSPLLEILHSRNPVINKQVKAGPKNQSFLLSTSFSLKADQGEQLVNFCLIPNYSTESEEIKNARLSAIVEYSNDAIISKDLNGHITSWNKAAEKLFKYTEEEVIGKHISLLFPEDRLKDERMILDTIKRGEQIKHFETIRLDKTGKEIPLSLTISPIKDSAGRIIGASKVAREISERLESEKKQAHLSAIVEHSDDAIISKDLNGTITSWNHGASKIFGYSEEEVLGKPITLLIPAERLQEEDLILKKIKSGEKIQHFETVRVTKVGKEIPVSLSVSPIKNLQGAIIGASKIARNIEEQIRFRKKIKAYNVKLNILNSVGRDISSNLDVQTVIQKVTDACTKLSGAKFGAFFYNTENGNGESMMLYTLSGAPKEAFENLGMPRHTAVFQSTFTGQGAVRIDDITSDARYGQNYPFNGMPPGHLKVVSYMAIPVISSSGKVTGGLLFGHPEKGVFQEEHEMMIKSIAAQAAIALDNSRLFERVKSLSEKKDEFIALASHELKTPLTTVKGYLQILEKKIEEPSSRLFLSKALEQADRLHTLIEDLLNMSRIEAGKLEFHYEEFDLREMLLDLAETFSHSASTHQIITNLGENPVIVKADKQRLEQALINLLSNAVKYSPTAQKVHLNLSVNDENIRVGVRDEGIGLTEEEQKQVFSRFYRAESTKGINGLGLGLYLTKQIIDAHHGQLAVESKVGAGSEFYFMLPRIC
ncbi:PAS domain S-box protein [Zunongwangia sp. F363]|uniref:histidine kinase n=1 Tax=Autumnicola tepida TaxID=3075595 RepID=A0ABU3C923_9FLAO|nr:PAS domain S-box protein [Zunongwangia sp. F363]MDT0642796.1 PAS domain S-box protein [Zunongwangia sp. F363]